jgi:caa(3)-type oxidase subunit IV
MSEQGHHPNYTKIYITLVVLLCISVAGPHLGIFWVTLITAFGIALVKADLVIQNFMHLKVERRIVKWMLATSLILVGLFVAGVAPDVMKHRGLRWENLAAEAEIARGIPLEPRAAEGATSREGAEAGPVPSDPGPAAAVAATVAVTQSFDAKGTFTSVCAACHGADGTGDGMAAASLNPKPADFTDPAFWKDKTDAELLKAIKDGGAAVGKSPMMVAWGGTFSDDQIQALLTYIESTFRPKGQ